MVSFMVAIILFAELRFARCVADTAASAAMLAAIAASSDLETAAAAVGMLASRGAASVAAVVVPTSVLPSGLQAKRCLSMSTV